MIPDTTYIVVPSNAQILSDHQSSSPTSPVHKAEKLPNGIIHATQVSDPPASTAPRNHTESQRPKWLANAKTLPPPGPLHYTWRRTWWLAPVQKVTERPRPSSSRLKFEQLLKKPGAVRSNEAWKGGIERVWQGLMDGGRLKQNLPMSVVVRQLSIISKGTLLIPGISAYRSRSFTPVGCETTRGLRVQSSQSPLMKVSR